MPTTTEGPAWRFKTARTSGALKSPAVSSRGRLDDGAEAATSSLDNK
ncbi:hypothetical protein V1291_001185 [Nitrobacteraceae bacterium AZCC 1564]